MQPPLALKIIFLKALSVKNYHFIWWNHVTIIIHKSGYTLHVLSNMLWDFTSQLYSNNPPLKYESLSHGSLPFEQKLRVFHDGHQSPHALDTFIAAPTTGHTAWTHCQEDFRYKGSTTLIPIVV